MKMNSASSLLPSQALQWDDPEVVELGLLIREVETTLLRFFSEGRLNGTVHTCLGQEYSAIAFAYQAAAGDYIFSGHRCHGHFIAATGRYDALIAEVLGKRSGVCGGVGSSQHLHAGRFFSNGVQGGIVPLAAGAAFAEKLLGSNAIAIVFIGDGTLGEGVLYETLNIAAKWSLPLLVVCENNRYAQTTPVEHALAGDIAARAEAFAIPTFRAATWEPQALLASASQAMERVRTAGSPAFFIVDTDRLAPHSKGDDSRQGAEVAAYQERDPLTRLLAGNRLWRDLDQAVKTRVTKAVAVAEADGELSIEDYYAEPDEPLVQWQPLLPVHGRQVERINTFFSDAMAEDERILFIGEDVLSPYGGAFKVAKNLSVQFPGRVVSTPISEAAIVGIGNGLALCGMRPFVELMFGDFTTLAFDQLLNHAAKFRHMYNHQIACPIVVRAPMGGRRGYGPTHSQTLDKFLLGIDQINVVALNTFVDPGLIYRAVLECRDPVFIIENKLDYGAQMQGDLARWMRCARTDHAFPTVALRPDVEDIQLTMVAYGGMVQAAIEAMQHLFEEHEVAVELLIPSRIRPLHYAPILAAVEQTRHLLLVEEGSLPGGFGSEVAACVHERATQPIRTCRVGAAPVPIPSARGLETAVLPSAVDIVSNALQLLRKR